MRWQGWRARTTLLTGPTPGPIYRRSAAARISLRALEGRELTPEEYAAVLFHDSTKRDLGRKNHGPMGADRAAKILAAAHLMSAKENKGAELAIRVHDDNLAKFPSHTAELLASADANPPDVVWNLNKSYAWGITHGLNGDDRYRNTLEDMPPFYGTGGGWNAPGIYQRYHGDRYTKYRDAMAKLDFDTIKQRVEAYRKKYGIGPDEPRVIHNV